VAAFEFDTDTAVDRLGDATYSGTVTDRWSIGHVPNGGYTMAIAQRALLDALGRPDPLTVTAHFLRPPAEGPVTLHVEQVRAGRRTATGAVRLEQDGVERLRLFGIGADLGAGLGAGASSATDLAYCDGAPPVLPQVEECLRVPEESPSGDAVPISARFDVAYHPDHVGCARGAPTGNPEVAAWVRLADGRDPAWRSCRWSSTVSPPTAFELGAVGWVPTLELTLHVRARPVPGWLGCVTRSRFLTGGLIEEDAEMWDSGDRLVARARQLSMAPSPT
jgi:hypothetical protein